MARHGLNGRCSVCQHRERARIEYALARGGSRRAVGERFGVSGDACWRHWRHHVQPELKAAHVAGQIKSLSELQSLVAEENGSILENLRITRGALYHLLEGAIVANDRNGVAILTGRIHENLGMVARLTGELAKVNGSVFNTQVNILVSPAYLELRTLLIRALARFPEARREVVAALEKIESDAMRAAAPAPGLPAPVPAEAA